MDWLEFVERFLFWLLVVVIALAFVKVGFEVGKVHSDDYAVMARMCGFVAGNNKSLFNVEGVYSSEGYYCVLDSASVVDINHEKCHKLVYNDYNHFCKGGG